MATKPMHIVVNVPYQEHESLKKLDRQLRETFRVNAAEDFIPAGAGTGVPPIPQPLPESKLPEIDARIANHETALANAQAQGSAGSRGNQDLQERLQDELDKARQDFTFQAKREELREKLSKTQDEKRVKYMLVCEALTKIPGISQTRLNTITMNRTLGLGDDQVTLKEFLASIKALADGEEKLTYTAATTMISKLGEKQPDTALHRDSVIRFSEHFVTIVQLAEHLQDGGFLAFSKGEMREMAILSIPVVNGSSTHRNQIRAIPIGEDSFAVWAHKVLTALTAICKDCPERPSSGGTVAAATVTDAAPTKEDSKIKKPPGSERAMKQLRRILVGTAKLYLAKKLPTAACCPFHPDRDTHNLPGCYEFSDAYCRLTPSEQDADFMQAIAIEKSKGGK